MATGQWDGLGLLLTESDLPRLATESLVGGSLLPSE